MFSKNNLILFALFIFCFCLYIFTLSPGWGAVNIFNTWDGLEYVICSDLLGIDHPPGHPLYILLGKAFSLIPFLGPAVKMNLMSAFFGALTILFVYLIVKQSLQLLMRLQNRVIREIIAVSSALLFALSRVFWTHCVITEVHTFYLFMISLAFYSALKWILEKKVQWLYLSSVLFGLTLSVNLFSAASFILSFIIFLGLVCLLDSDSRLQIREWAAVFALLILGLVFYAYYPLRASSAPFAHSMNYMMPFELGSFSWFLWFVSGRAWTGGGMFSLGRIFSNLPNYLNHLISNFTFVSIFLGFIPLLYLFGNIREQFRGKKISLLPGTKFILFLVISFAVVSLPQLMLQDVSNPGSTTYIYVANFYLPSFFIYALFVGIGLGILLDYLVKKDFHLRLLKALGLSDNISERGKRAWMLLLIYFLLALPVTLFALNLKQCNLRGRNEGYYLARDMLSLTKPKSIIMSKLIYQLVHAYFFKVEKTFQDKKIDLVNPDLIDKDIERRADVLPMLSRSKRLETMIKRAVEQGKTVYISGDSIDQDKAPEYPLISDLYLKTEVPPYFLFSLPSTGFPITELILYRVDGFHVGEVISKVTTLESRGIANDGNFADKLELLGYDFREEDQRFGRKKIDIMLYWKVLDDTNDDFIGLFAVFNSMFQRVDPARATTFYTLGGEKGSSKWKKGTIIKEDTTFYIPNLPFGEYYLALGILKKDGTTLPYYPASFRQTGRAFDFVLLLPFGIGIPAQNLPFRGR